MELTDIKRGITTTLSAIFIFAILLIVLFALGVVWPQKILAPIKTNTPLAITNVTVVDISSSQLIIGQTVLIDNGRITAIDDNALANVPTTAQRIDGTNRYLIPALWDMHTHIYAVSPMLDLPLHIAYGVTNIRDMQGCPQKNDPFIACPEDKRQWSAEAVNGERIGPRIQATTSFMANGPGMIERMKGLPDFFGTATSEQAQAFVQHFANNVDAIKVYDRISRHAYFALIDEAQRLGVDAVGHRPHAISAIEAATHQKSIEHARFILHESFRGSEALRQTAGTPQWYEDRRRMLDEHDPVMADAIFTAMRESGTWYVPTHLTRWVDAYADDDLVRKDPLLRYLHPLMKWQWLEDVNATIDRHPSPAARQTYREFYKKGLELTGAAQEAEVNVLVGTDYIVAGAYVHRELEQLVLAGLTPTQALHAATLAPAEYFGLQKQFGSVTQGKVADLILLNANPLTDIRNTQQIESVIFNGNYYPQQALRQISEHVENQANSWSVACKILWRFIKNPVAY